MTDKQILWQLLDYTTNLMYCIKSLRDHSHREDGDLDLHSICLSLWETQELPENHIVSVAIKALDEVE